MAEVTKTVEVDVDIEIEPGDLSDDELLELLEDNGFNATEHAWQEQAGADPHEFAGRLDDVMTPTEILAVAKALLELPAVKPLVEAEAAKELAAENKVQKILPHVIRGELDWHLAGSEFLRDAAVKYSADTSSTYEEKWDFPTAEQAKAYFDGPRIDNSVASQKGMWIKHNGKPHVYYADGSFVDGSKLNWSWQSAELLLVRDNDNIPF